MKLNSPLKRLIRVFVVALLVITAYLLIDGKVHSIVLATEKLITDLEWKSYVVGIKLNEYKQDFEKCSSINKLDSALKPQLIELNNFLTNFQETYETEKFDLILLFGKDSITHKIDFNASNNLHAVTLNKNNEAYNIVDTLTEKEVNIFLKLAQDNVWEEQIGVFTPLKLNNMKLVYVVFTPAGSWLDLVKEKLFTNLLVVFIVIAVTFYFTYRSLNKIVKSEEEIKKQLISAREIIEEKNTEITDSIKYAKRLQTAIQLPEDKLKELNLNCFIFYQPKDIVAGDFYWIQDTPNTIYVAAADCTGHGVPGAMVSMLCINLLNKSLQEIPDGKPNQLLHKVCEELRTLFNTGSEEIKDGMDISLMAFDKNLKKIYWSGAFNPLWIINDNGFTEIKADRQSVSGVGEILPFTLHELAVDKDSWFYLFSDGYADQFGGPKNKKFRYKQLQELFSAIQHEPAAEQHKRLQTTFNRWKGTQEQVDDVLIIGVNFNMLTNY